MLRSRPPRPPTFQERLSVQILALAVLVLLPVLWIILILYGLCTALFSGSNATSSARKIIYAVTLWPFSITFENCSVLARFLSTKRKGFVWGVFGKETADPSRTSSYRSHQLRQSAPEDVESCHRHSKPTRPELSAQAYSSSQTPYQFCPLKGDDEFRLIIIAPGSYDDPLHGDLVSTSFSSHQLPAYDALSYTWADETGDVARSSELACERPKATIRITKNCDAAIRRLRLPDERRRVWIDAVCIDQDNDAERTHQVSLMSRIYTSARCVVVYTGEGTAQTDQLFDWLNGLKTEELASSSSSDLYNLAEDVTASLERFWNAGKERVLELIRNPRPGEDISLSKSELIGLVAEYFSRRWFKRVWVLQEVVLPDPRRTTVMCGTKNIPAMRALLLISLLHNHPSGSMVRILVLVRKKVESINSHLLDVLIETRDREAGDPRDKIFGVLSISNALDKGMFPELEADYGKTTAEAYVYYSAFFIQHYGPGFFLSLMKSLPKLTGMPSWAADWTVSWPNYKAVYGKDFAAASRTAHDRDSGAVFSEEDGLRILTLARSRILRGYFTRNGHLDGSSGTCSERVEDLGEVEVLIALLQKEGDYYAFVQICPHALSEWSMIEIVERWSSVVVDLEGPKEETGQNLKRLEYLGPVEIFKIR
ncbi:hypothetical protein DL770_003411 [Monosporascus sp. CRB-9-2]|nr:hypothetical protein DL770_003411 [Monosporascus sp. CRB-9-2]